MKIEFSEKKILTSYPIFFASILICLVWAQTAHSSQQDLTWGDCRLTNIHSSTSLLSHGHWTSLIMEIGDFKAGSANSKHVWNCTLVHVEAIPLFPPRINRNGVITHEHTFECVTDSTHRYIRYVDTFEVKFYQNARNLHVHFCKIAGNMRIAGNN